MTPRKAKTLLEQYFGPQAATMFDPLWPETMLGVSPGVDRDEVMEALRSRLTQMSEHAEGGSDDGMVLARALRSVAAQMIDGPGAEWTEDLESELGAPPLRLTLAGAEGPQSEEPVAGRFLRPPSAVVSEAERIFRRHARAMVATHGASAGTVARLHALAEADGLPSSVVQSFLDELVTPAEREPGEEGPPGRTSRPASSAVDIFGASRSRQGNSNLLLAAGAVVVLAIVAFSIFAAVAIIGRREHAAPPSTPDSAQPTVPQSGTKTTGAPQAKPPDAAAPTKTAPLPTADGPPDGRVFVRTISDALREQGPTAKKERVVLDAIAVLRRWWPRIDGASRVAAVQFIAQGVVDISQSDGSREALIGALRLSPSDTTSPAAVWHSTATAGLCAVLSRERELPTALLDVCRERQAQLTGQGLGSRRGATTFDEAATEALLILPPALLRNENQPASVTQAQADAWLEALRAGTGLSGGGSSDDAARRADLAILDTVERLLTSEPDASSYRSVFDFVAAVLPQVRFREGDPGRDRVLSWFVDTRLKPADIRLITGAVAMRSAAAGIEPTMVLAAGATQADRDDLRARYAEAWSKARAASNRAAGGANGDWYEGARNCITASNQATGDLEQLAAAANLASFSLAASLRWRGLPGQIPTGDTVPPNASKGFFASMRQSGPGSGDGEWARRFLGESRTAAGRLARISEFEQLGDPGPVDCEVLAEAALLQSGETRNAAQRAALKRTENPVMVNAILELLPKVKRSANTSDFLGQFSVAGVIPVSSDRWMFHYRKALVERLLTLLAYTNTTVAADKASTILAESWGTIAGTAAAEVADADGPTESVAAAARAYMVLVAQVRQQVPAPTALINPDTLDRNRAGRLLVAHGLPQAFAANEISAVEALAVLVAAERPASSDQCRGLLAELATQRAAARSVAAQIRLTEAVAVRLWAIRLGEPL